MSTNIKNNKSLNLKKPTKILKQTTKKENLSKSELHPKAKTKILNTDIKKP